MATIYIDPTVTGTGTGTLGDPFKSWASVTWVAGNTYLQAAGTTQVGYKVQVNTGGTSEANRVTLGSYDKTTGLRTTGGIGRAILNGVGTPQTIRVSSGVNFVTIDNFEVYGTDGTTGTKAVGVYAGNGPLLPSNDLVFTNLWVHDISAAVTPAGDNDGMQLFGDRITVQFCLIENIPTDGLWLQGSDYRITDNIIRNVSTNDIRGDSIQTNGDVDGRNDRGYIARNYLDHLNKNSKQVIIVGGIGYSADVVVEDNVCLMAPYDNIISTTCIFSESAGALIRRNICIGAYHGIFANTTGNNNRIESNICVSNQRGVSCNATVDGTMVVNNTVDKAGMHGIYLDTTGASTARNNAILRSAVGLAVRSTTVRGYNAFYGNATDFTALTGGGTIGANNITADPLLSTSYRPMAGSPLIGAGTHLGYRRDIEKKQRQNPPSIGAYDLATLRTAQ